MNGKVSPLWAKLERDAAGQITGWHSLVDHSADVAAVLQSLLEVPVIADRFSRLAGRSLDRVTVLRLAALSFLHDAGKANRGFQSRWTHGVRGAGHITEFAWLVHGLYADALRNAAFTALRAPLWETWFTDGSWPLFDAIFAHHGRPWKIESSADYQKLWMPIGDDNPIEALNIMGERMQNWFPEAFTDAPSLPEAPAFHHAFAGLLMLADWLGSDTEFFPYSNGKPSDRLHFARTVAPQALEKIGLSVQKLHQSSKRRHTDFETIFTFPASFLQQKMCEPTAPCVVLEAETGSGKTEASLWRFLYLFESGAVDGMYFALPTRVAATQVFQRVTRFADAAFGSKRPAVVLAVPGQIQADGVKGHALPDFGFAWDDDPDDATRQARWAASRPKRFLGAQIAVGTIDQALLGAIRTRHAHMRRAMLFRQLLVVDEVHASDSYMEELLSNLLQAHLQAGGHALLLSATLGAGMRSRLLGTSLPSSSLAEDTAYPALFWKEQGKLKSLAVAPDPERTKKVTITADCVQGQPEQIAELALKAARAGAKVLIIRNTVGAAIETQQALEAIDPTKSAQFTVAGVAAPHHGRFSPTDRVLLDHAVVRCLGKHRIQGGVIVIGTQTLEVSLDIDADLLITDLCPVDVLLQRIGRLHRHRRPRPLGFETPSAHILTPKNRDLLSMAKRGRHGLGTVYPDLRIIEATWRLIETYPIWEIPAMNRLLVERSTHRDHLTIIEAEFRAHDSGWEKQLATVEGNWRSEIQMAISARLDQDTPFDKLKFDADERVATRLGAADRLVDLGAGALGPFGVVVTQIRIPNYLLPDDTAAGAAEKILPIEDGFAFSLGSVRYSYDRFGLTKTNT